MSKKQIRAKLQGMLKLAEVMSQEGTKKERAWWKKQAATIKSTLKSL